MNAGPAILRGRPLAGQRRDESLAQWQADTRLQCAACVQICSADNTGSGLSLLGGMTEEAAAVIRNFSAIVSFTNNKECENHLKSES